MAHARTQIRDAVGTLLSASTAGLWKTVIKSRLIPQRDTFTFVLVFTENELTEEQEIHPFPVIDRQISLTTKAYLRITDDELIETQMDNVAIEIEKILTMDALNTALSGKLKSIALESSSMNVEDYENDRTAAVIALDWLVRVMTVEGDPETLI